MLGYYESRTVVHIGNKLGLNIQGTDNKCESCAKGKAEQRKLTEISETKRKRRGARHYMDISTVRDENYGGGKCCLLVLNDATDVFWSMILKKKSNLCEKILELILDLESKLKYSIFFNQQVCVLTIL